MSELEVIGAGRWSRRALLRAGTLSVGGLAAAALIGCGGDDEEGEEAAPAAAGTAAATATGESSGATGIGKLVQDPDLPYPFNFPEPATEPRSGGTMRVAGSWDVGILDPTTSSAGGTIVIPNITYNRLIKFPSGPNLDPFELRIEPELAASWERTPDGLVYTFKMQPGVTWQNLPPLNGRAFVADDAKRAYDRYAADGVHTSIWTNVSTIEAPDEETLQITLARPVVDFIWPLAGRYQTIFPPELVDDGSITEKAIGTGPMILTGATQGQPVTFDRNPDYWESDVYLDHLEFRFMPDVASRLAAFRSGQAEYAYSILTGLRDVEALVSTNPDVQVTVTPVTTGGAFALNNSLPKYQDERVRRAIALAIDTDLIEEVVYQGWAKTLGIPSWPYLFDQEPSVEAGEFGDWWRHDPEEAKQLLIAAGAEGLVMDNAYYTYSADYTQRTEILVPAFAEVGITMTGGAVDYTAFNSQWVGRKLADVTTSGWATAGFDADNVFFNQIHSQSPGNRWFINDPQIDEWAEAQQVEIDEGARREILRKIWDRLNDQMYRPPLPNQFRFEAYQPWLRGVRFGGAEGSSSFYYDWGVQLPTAWLDQ